MIYTQAQFCQRLRQEGLRVSPSTVHRMVQAGMPVVTVPHLKKPRFHWPTCWAWIISTREADPLTMLVRDQILRQARRGRVA